MKAMLHEKPANNPRYGAAGNMSDNEDGFSFDPKTWNKAENKAAARAETAPAEPVSPVPAPESPTKIPDENTVPSRRNLMALGAGGALLLTGGITAFLSRSKTPPVQAATAAPPLPAGTMTRSLTLAQAGDLQSALVSAGVPAEEAGRAATAALGTLGSTNGSLRLVMHLTGGAATQLERAEVTRPDSSGVSLVRSGSGFTATAIAASVTTEVVVKRGEIDRDSFYTSAVTAGITDSLIPEFAKAFAYDFDFQREINPGDIFEAAFEQGRNASGEPVGIPRLVYASLSTNAKSRALYAFTPEGLEPGWFDGNGISIIRSFLRTPVDGARITSRFGIRVHPVLGFVKAHKGTDFGAPTGTPIYAAGDGAVTWAAMKGPNGNLVILQHDNGWQTYYLHMDRFGDGITPGVRVRQGQTIGYVGTTGRSTGPHLHYEMHVNGEAVDAMTMPMDEGHSLKAAELTAFQAERDRIDSIRSQA